MKKMIFGFWLLCLFFCIPGISAQNESGTCGHNVIYTINGDTIFFANDQSSFASYSSSCTDIFKDDPSITKVKIVDMIDFTSGNFSGCQYIREMDISKLDISQTSYLDQRFKDCSSLQSLDLSSWDTSNVTDMYGLFSGCSSLQSVNLTNWDTSNVTDMSSMFSGCSSLQSLDLSNLNTSNLKELHGTFAQCSSLQSLNVSNWSTSNVSDMAYLFKNCSSLNNLDLSNWDTSQVRNMSDMFYGCSSLQGLDVSNWNTSNVSDMSDMFYDCSSLQSLDISKWNTSHLNIATNMFSGCSTLQSLDFSNWALIQRYSFNHDMFVGCSSLRTITLGNYAVGDSRTIFYDMPNYWDEWFYIKQGKEATQPLDLLTSRTGNYLFDSYNYKTMAGTWTTDENVILNPLSDGDYLILVVDENGDPLPDAVVTWEDQTGSQTGTSDANGKVFFDALSIREPVITVEKTDYITWTNSDIYWEKSPSGRETIILYPESAGPLKLKSARYSNNQDLSLSTNILTGTKKISLPGDADLSYDPDNRKFYLSCSAIDKSAVSSYEIWQGNKSVAQSQDGFFELSSLNFTAGGKCFVRVTGKDGTHADTNINLIFSKSEINSEHEINFNGSKISIAVADNVPYLGGKKLEIDFGKYNIKIPATYVVTNNRLKIGFNTNISGDEDPEEAINKVKKFTDELKQAKGQKIGKLNKSQMQKYKSLIKDKNKISFLDSKPEINFLGYAEGNWDSNTISGSLMLMIKLDVFSLEYNTICVIVPVTVQVELSVDGTVSFEISYNTKNYTLDGNLGLVITPKLKAFGGVGVSKLIGVGAYGSAELEWDFEIIPAFDTNSLDLTGELGIKAYVGFLSYEQPFAYNTWHIITRTKPKEFGLLAESFENQLIDSLSEEKIYKSVPAGLYDASQYHRADFSYLQEEADHMKPEEQHGLSTKTGSEVMTFEKLIENTYRNAQPVMISADGTAFAAFLRADTSGRVYAVISKNSGSGWIEPVEISSSDVLADRPILLADTQNRVWLAYSRTGNSFNNSTLTNWAESQELVVGLVDPDTLSFTPYRTYSGLDYIHMHTFALVSGTPSLVWLSSQVGTDNDVLWPLHNTLYQAAFDGSAWSTPAVLGTVDHAVTELAAGEENGTLSIGYVMDMDDDNETTDDHALLTLSGGQSQTLSPSASAVSFGTLPGSAEAGFIWFEAGSLHSSNGSEAAGIFSSEYRIVENNIYYSAATEKGAELCLSRYDNGTWSEPIFLTDGEGYLENISAARINGTDYVLGMYTTPVIGESGVQDSKDLVWSAVSSVSDIVIEGAEYDDEDLQPGQIVPVTLTIRNAGDHPVSSVDIRIDNQSASAQTVDLGLGESEQIIVVLTIPSEMSKFRLSASETGKTDYRPEDNQTEVTLGSPDLTVSLEWDQIGNSSKVIAVVRNKGIAPAAGKLSLTDRFSNTLSEKYFSDLLPGESVIGNIDINWDQMDEKQYDVRAAVESFQDERILYNNKDSIHLTNYAFERIENTDIKLPAGLVSIGDEAFAGCSFSAVMIPEGVVSIGEKAFAGCENLRQIDIPSSVTEIAANAFEGTKGLVIYCPDESEAQNFAYRNGFVYITE